MAAFNQPLNSNRGAAYESLTLYQSEDGINFFPVTKSGAFTHPNGLRDPSIRRGADGAYYLTFSPVSLDSVNNTSFPIYRSTNLSTWTLIKTIDCTYQIATMPGSVPNTAWGPVFDDVDGEVYLHVTINATGGLVVQKALTADMTSWSPMERIVINGSPNGYVTDAGIIKIGSTYHLWGPDGTGGLGHSVSKAYGGPYTTVASNQRFGSADFIEGGQPVEVSPGRYRLYFDQSYQQPAPGMSFVETSDPDMMSGFTPLALCRIAGEPNAGRLRNSHIINASYPFF